MIKEIETLRSEGNYEEAYFKSLWTIAMCESIKPNSRKLTGLLGKIAKQVTNLMFDKRSINAVDTCIRYGNGDATEEELVLAAELAEKAFEEEVEDLKSIEEPVLQEQKQVISGSFGAAAVAFGATVCLREEFPIFEAAGLANVTVKAYCCVYPDGKEEIEKIISDLCWDCLNED